MLKSNLCDFSDAYRYIQGTVAIQNTGTAGTPNNRNKNLIFKNFVPFTDYINKINNAQVDNVKEMDAAMSMYNNNNNNNNNNKINE